MTYLDALLHQARAARSSQDRGTILHAAYRFGKEDGMTLDELDAVLQRVQEAMDDRPLRERT